MGAVYTDGRTGTPLAPLVLAADPRASTGVAASIGTYGTYGGNTFYKSGAADTAWARLGYFARTAVSGSAVTNITFSGLNGDLDKTYNMEGYIVSVAGAGIDLQPNGLSTNQFTIQDYGPNAQTLTTLNVGETRITGTGYTFFSATIRAVTGKPRFLSAVNLETANGAGVYGGVFRGVWTDTSANITSLVLNVTGSSRIGVGSIVTCWSPSNEVYL